MKEVAVQQKSTKKPTTRLLNRNFKSKKGKE
jgi:hypothetical protein